MYKGLKTRIIFIEGIHELRKEKVMNKKQMKNFYISIGILVLITLISVIFFISCKNLNVNEKISNTILLITCIAWIISIIFLYLNFRILNNSFLKSLEPALLIQVYEEIIDQNKTGRTIIHYVNTSNNYFSDLTIFCYIKIGRNTSIDYTDLFKDKMYMGPKDGRDRRFNFLEDLEKKKNNLKEIKENNIDIILSISFSYTFNEEIKKITIQEYKYNFNVSAWEII